MRTSALSPPHPIETNLPLSLAPSWSSFKSSVTVWSSLSVSLFHHYYRFYHHRYIITIVIVFHHSQHHHHHHHPPSHPPPPPPSRRWSQEKAVCQHTSLVDKLHMTTWCYLHPHITRSPARISPSSIQHPSKHATDSVVGLCCRPAGTPRPIVPIACYSYCGHVNSCDL